MTQVEQIRNIPIREVFSRYGFEINRAGFCRCPFHHEKTPSCKVYKDSFYCFGCGAHGDSIDFVKQYDNVGFKEAVDRISAEFGISDETRSNAQRLADSKAAFMRRKAQEKRESELNDLRDEWRNAIKRLRYAEDLFKTFEPENPEDEWSYAFTEAIKAKERAMINADIAMEKLNKFEHSYLQI